MAWFLFLDESGTDRRTSDYEVIAGIAVEDCGLWALIQDIKQAQEECFGMRLFDAYGREAKGNKLLKNKVFRHASQQGTFEPERRIILAKNALTQGNEASRQELSALGHAKIAYVENSLQLCARANVKAFATIVSNDAERPEGEGFLSKKYSFLFERFYSLLKEQHGNCMGMIIFDENEKTLSHRIATSMEEYFLKTKNGRERAKHIIPEPLFVHSDLTSMVQMADLVAYIVCQGVRLNGMKRRPREKQLRPLVDRVERLRYASRNGERRVWGFKFIPDLMPRRRVSGVA